MGEGNGALAKHALAKEGFSGTEKEGRGGGCGHFGSFYHTLAKAPGSRDNFSEASGNKLTFTDPLLTIEVMRGPVNGIGGCGKILLGWLIDRLVETGDCLKKDWHLFTFSFFLFCCCC
jgi:hypothetical protein